MLFFVIFHEWSTCMIIPTPTLKTHTKKYDHLTNHKTQQMATCLLIYTFILSSLQAILSSDFEAFRATVEPWIAKSLTVSAKETSHLNPIEKTIPDVKSAIAIFSYNLPQ